uniref:Uncharacterized protein n=1 Tax=Oryza barthii TaxID=65489 RepID=A0A0D3HPG8_9ORYZ
MLIMLVPSMIRAAESEIAKNREVVSQVMQLAFLHKLFLLGSLGDELMDKIVYHAALDLSCSSNIPWINKPPIDERVKTSLSITHRTVVVVVVTAHGLVIFGSLLLLLLALISAALCLYGLGSRLELPQDVAENFPGFKWQIKFRVQQREIDPDCGIETSCLRRHIRDY